MREVDIGDVSTADIHFLQYGDVKAIKSLGEKVDVSDEKGLRINAGLS